jgi:hypothetical protein
VLNDVLLPFVASLVVAYLLDLATGGAWALADAWRRPFDHGFLLVVIGGIVSWDGDENQARALAEAMPRAIDSLEWAGRCSRACASASTSPATRSCRGPDSNAAARGLGHDLLGGLLTGAWRSSTRLAPVITRSSGFYWCAKGIR